MPPVFTSMYPRSNCFNCGLYRKNRVVHKRYYGYLVVWPLATYAADILGRYHSRRAAEQAAEQQFWPCLKAWSQS